jgi:recombination protein RecA
MSTADPKARSLSPKKPVLDAEALKKRQALDAAIGAIDKQYGKGTMMKLGEVADIDIRGISTGSISLDIALGGKGLPCGRIVEVYGPESSGKTTLALHVIASAQREGGHCAYIDAEHALDPSYARKIGVVTDDLLVSQPDFGEQALEITETLVRSNAVDVIVVDSVAALVPKAELEGEMGDSFVGLQARLMSQALRKLTGAVHKSTCVLIFINQIREKIGVMFGSPETTAGGRALKFYASVRLDVRRIGKIKDGEEVTGSRVKTTVVKNKLAPPFRVAEFDIMFNEGISYLGDLIDLASENGVVDKTGSWLSFGDERLGQGRDKAKDFLQTAPETAKKIHAALVEKLGPKASEKPEAAAPAGKPEAAASAGKPEAAASARPATPSAAAGSVSIRSVADAPVARPAVPAGAAGAPAAARPAAPAAPSAAAEVRRPGV